MTYPPLPVISTRARSESKDFIYSAKWFGATGAVAEDDDDGIELETQAIERALESAVAHRHPIWFQGGTSIYRLARVLYIESSFVTLVGDPGVRVVGHGSDPEVMFFDGGASCGGGLREGLQNCCIVDLRVDGTGGQECAIRFRGVNHSQFQNVTFANVTMYGMLFESCWASRIDSPKFSTFFDDVDVAPHDGVHATRTRIQEASAIDATANTFTVRRHGFVSGDEVVLSNQGGSLPAALAAATHAIRVDADTLKFAASEEDALDGTAIDWSGGSGTQYVQGSLQQCETLTFVSPVIEEITSAGSGTAMKFDYAENCTVIGGLLENCDVAAWCTENSVNTSFHGGWMNSITADVVDEGESNVFTNGQTQAEIQIRGTARFSKFDGGKCNGDVTISTGARGSYVRLGVLGTITDNGIDSTIECWDPTTATRIHRVTGECYLPPPNEFRRRTGLTPAALFLCDEASGDLRNAMDNAALTLSDPGDATHRKWVYGLRGVTFDVNVGRFYSAGLYNPGAASQMRIAAFSVAAHHGGNVGIEGSCDTLSNGVLTFVGTADDRVHVVVKSGVNGFDQAVGNAITYGDPYVVGALIDRDDDTLYLELVNLRTGVRETSSVSIATAPDLSDDNDVFQIGWLDNIGVADGVTILGVAIVDAGVEAGGALLLQQTLAAFGTL